LVVERTDAGYWRARAEAAEARAEAAAARVAELEARVAELSEQVAVLSRMLFGRSSEKKEATDGPEAGDAEGEAGVVPGQPASGAGAGCRRGQRPGSTGHGRRDYSHLQTREEFHDVPAGERVCAGCGTSFEPLGFEDSEQIDWQVRITRIVHRRRRYRRRCSCPGLRTVVAPIPAKPVAKGRFTSEFLARLLFEKYVLGLPVHRIAKALAADGLDVAAGTLSGALKAVPALLAPLQGAIAARNTAAGHVHADETSWRVFERIEGKDGTRWWLWVFVAEDTVVFTMDPTRSAAVAERHFGIDRARGALSEGRRLIVSSDFFTVYQSLARVDGVDPLWCWAHIRRYFIRAGDAHRDLRAWRDGWVERIAVLYLAHRDLAATGPGSEEHRDATLAFEQALAAMDTARHAQQADPGLHPAAAKVLATLDREWDGPARHRDLPDIDLDNNRAERALRTPVVGRKNFYGSQALWSAHLAAAVWTITATAERHGREPLAYLTEYLTACARSGSRAPDGQALAEFLPWLTPDQATGSRDHDPGSLHPPHDDDHRQPP
jgi:transposase